MPGQGEVKAPPQPLAGHEGLSGAALLARAAVKDDRAARAAALEEVLYGEGSAQRARTEHVVPAAVPRPAGDERFFLRAVRRLAEPGKGVVFAEDADHRLSLAEFAAEGGLYAAKALRHLEPVLAEYGAVERRALELLQRKLRLAPDGVGNAGENTGVFVYVLYRFLLEIVHISTLLKKS